MNEIRDLVDAAELADGSIGAVPPGWIRRIGEEAAKNGRRDNIGHAAPALPRGLHLPPADIGFGVEPAGAVERIPALVDMRVRIRQMAVEEAAKAGGKDAVVFEEQEQVGLRGGG